MLYSDIDLGIGSSLDYEINGVPLKNIISESSDTITLNENVLYEGKTEISNLINAISNTLNLSILYDKNNVLHKELKKLSYYISNINDINKTITLKDSELSLEISYNAIITVKRDGNPNGFTLLTLNIQRSD
jgi:hypothetical protein